MKNSYNRQNFKATLISQLSTQRLCHFGLKIEYVQGILEIAWKQNVKILSNIIQIQFIHFHKFSG